MLEEKIDVLIAQQKITNDYLGQLIEIAFEATNVKESVAKEVVEAVEETVKKTPAKKTKPKPVDETPVEEAPVEAESKATLKDIVALCADGAVTRSNVLALLDEFGAKKLPDLDEKSIPEFHARLVEISQQNKAA